MENSDIHLCRENGDLGELPSELQYKIAQGFSAPDLARLAQVSTAFRDVAKGTHGYFSKFYLQGTLDESSDAVSIAADSISPDSIADSSDTVRCSRREKNSHLTYDQDTKTVFSGFYDMTIKAWTPDGSGNYHANSRQTLSGHSGAVRALAYDQDLKTLFSGSHDTNINVWTPDGSGNYQASQTLTGHSDRVTALACDQGTKTLFSGSGDKTIKVWTPDGSGNYHDTQTLDATQCISLTYDQVTKTLFSRSLDKSVKVWTTGK